MKILIAVPSYLGIRDAKGKPRNPAFAQSLANTLELLNANGHSVTFCETVGNCYIQMVRNEFAGHAADIGADVLACLDDDLSWDAADAVRMIERPEPVVAGIYRRKREIEDYPVALPVTKDGFPIVRHGLILADYVPTGFLFIKGAALAKLRESMPDRKYEVFEDGGKVNELYDFFPQGLRDGRLWGEDYAFCHLWRSIGGMIWVVPDITLTHWRGNTPFAGNYHQFLLKQPGGSNDPARAA